MSIDCKVISKKLNTHTLGKSLSVYESLTSTNDVIRDFPRENGITIIAKSQTNGRGRLGRSWASADGGIYMSFLLTPPFEVTDVSVITIIAGLAVCTAIEKHSLCQIKWPNDIVINGKKVCGILAQGITSNGQTDAIIVGIGVNANTKEFNDEIKSTATSISLECAKEIDENSIVCDILEGFEKLYYSFDADSVIDKVKQKCITLNSEVTVHFHSDKCDVNGICTDILPSGTLEVTTRDGNKICVTSGEVSVRGIYGYAK